MGRLAAVLLILVSLPSAARAEREEAPDERARRAAQEALTRGDELRDDGRCEAAVAAYRAGLAEVQHWAFLLRIGNCFERLGRNEEAVSYLVRGLELAGPELAGRGRDEVLSAIERARRELPTRLMVASPVGGLGVLLDDEPLGETPLDATVEVQPGGHTVTAIREGLPRHETRVTARRGETTVVMLDVAPPAAEAAAATDGGEEARPAPSRPWWAFALVVLGAGLAGGGGYLIALDGNDELTRGLELDTIGPGAAASAAGAGLLLGGILLLALPPERGD